MRTTLALVRVLVPALTLTLSGCLQTGVIGGAGLADSAEFNGITGVAVLSPTTVKLSWNASTNYSRYQIFSTSSTSTLGESIFATYLVNNLSPDTNYTFSVGGTNKNTGALTGVDKNSTIRTWAAFTGISTLAAPNPTQLQANWSYQVQGPTYKVYVKTGSTFAANDPALDTPALSTADSLARITQLADGTAIAASTTYYVLVRATYLDGTTDTNANIATVKTPSNISPEPIISIDETSIGRWPAFTVSGALSNYTTVFKRNGTTIASIRGNGTVQPPSSLPLDVGLNTIDVTVSDGTHTADLDSHDVTTRTLGTTPMHAPALNYDVTNQTPRGVQRAGVKTVTGDFNCDGYQDVAMDAPYATTQPLVSYGSADGAVYVYYGSSTGLVTSPLPSNNPQGARHPLLLARPRTGTASTTNLYFGRELAAGNINADRNGTDMLTSPECDDLVVGTDITNSATGQGEVWVFFGSTTGLQQGAYVQNSSACAGAICAPLLITPPTGSWRAPTTNAYFGFSIAVGRLHMPADANDRYRDIIIGAAGDHSGPEATPNNSSCGAWIYYGSDTGINFTRIQDKTGFWDANNRPFTRLYPHKGSYIANYYHINCRVAAVNLDGDTNNIDDVVIGMPVSSSTGVSIHGAIYYFSSKIYVGDPPIAGKTYSNTLLNTSAGTLIDPNPVWPATIYMYGGRDVKNIGDVNGDGIPDLAVVAGRSAAGNNPNDFATADVYIIYGSTSGPQTATCRTNRSTKGTGSTCALNQTQSCDSPGVCSSMYISTITGGATPTRSIYWDNSIATFASNTLNLNKLTYTGPGDVDTVNDVNHDGYSDLLVGYPGWSAYTSEARLYFGGVTGVNPAGTRIKPATNGPYDNFGGAVALGNFNGDAYVDAVATAPDNFTLNGPAGGVGYVFNGQATGLSSTYVTTSNLVLRPSGSYESNGLTALAAGDINGDGYGDAIALYNHPFMEQIQPFGPFFQNDAVIFYGSANGLIMRREVNGVIQDIRPAITPLYPTDPTVIPSPAGSGYYTWQYATPVGDVNGDGYADVMTQGYTSAVTYQTFLYYGSLTGIQTALPPTQPPTSGLTPVIMSNNAAIQATIWSGSWPVNGMISHGDFNADGFSDIAFGYAAQNGNRGRAWVIYGSASGPQTDGTLTVADPITHTPSDSVVFVNPCDPSEDPENPTCLAQQLEPVGTGQEYFGSSVSSLGDIDGDGYEDLIVGAGARQVGAAVDNNGAAYIYFGGPNGLETWGSTYSGMIILPQILVAQTNRICGLHSGYAGDINGDGFNDVIIGCTFQNVSGANRNGAGIVLYGCQSNRHVAGGTPATGCSAAGLQGVVTPPLNSDPAIGTSITPIPLVNSNNSCANGVCQPMMFYPKNMVAVDSYWSRVIGSPGDLNRDGRNDVIIGTVNPVGTCTTAACPSLNPTMVGAAVILSGSANGLQAGGNVTRYPSCSDGVCAPYLITPDMSGWGVSSASFWNFSWASFFNSSTLSDYNGDGLPDFILNTRFYTIPGVTNLGTAVSGGFYVFQ